MKRRIVTGVTAGAAFLLMLGWGGWAYRIVVVALAVWAAAEFQRLSGVRSVFANGCAVAAVALIVVEGEKTFLFAPKAAAGESAGALLFGVWVLTALLLAGTVVSRNRLTYRDAALTVLGVFYVGIGFRAMLAIREFGERGFWVSLFLFAVVWATDSGAYFSGKWFGRHKWMPELSPNKTVEGAIGGVAAATACAVLFAAFAPVAPDMAAAAGWGASLAVVAQLGDLIQSAYKRVQGVKDSGAVLPGHGGVLDRTDSWLIVFPFVYFLPWWPM